MTITTALKNSWKYLPVLNAINYANKTLPEKISIPEVIGHSIYAGAGLVALMVYSAGLFQTGEINPLNQVKVFHQRITEKEKYNQMLFNSNGLADSNHDGKISIEEKARAFGIMGLESQINFPEPSAEQLEKTVRSYQGEK